MRILLLGRMEGWMGLYLSQLAQGFREEGVECRTLNYRAAGLRTRFRLMLAHEKKKMLKTERTRRVIEAIRAFSPDIIITNSGQFDLPRIHEATEGCVVFWDMDGPEGELLRQDFPWENGIDIVLTVSRPLARRLSLPLRVPVIYLPHGVDVQFYCPGPVSNNKYRRLHASLTFVGRVCERRKTLLLRLADLDLALWGKSWANHEVNERLKACLRSKKDITGLDLVDVYRCSDVALNILRDPFMNPPSILSLQAFSIPAAGACLLTDWVEELEDAFIPDQEVAVFRSDEELIEKARRLSHDRKEAGKIGDAGRKRAEAHHSLRQRARSILSIIRTAR